MSQEISKFGENKGRVKEWEDKETEGGLIYTREGHILPLYTHVVLLYKWKKKKKLQEISNKEAELRGV